MKELTKDGKSIWVNLAISPRFNDSGNIIGLMGMGQNITQRKQMQVQLNHAQKMESVGQMAAGIAHEMNTPLQYIGDNIRFLKDSFADLLDLFKEYRQLIEKSRIGNSQGEMLQRFKTQVEEKDLDFLMDEIPEAVDQSLEGVSRVSKIVQAMKEFSHPGMEEKKLSDINRAIETTVNVSRNEWKYVADIETDLDGDLPLVPCYLNDFNQVILNLIINASHAIEKGLKEKEEKKGTISIRTRHKDKWAEILVEDTGTGIPEEVQPKIFDPFFTTREVGKGTGQGLSMVHAMVVKKHQGSIAFETEVGEGTVFIIYLPLSPETESENE